MEYIIANISVTTLIQDTVSLATSILIGFTIWIVKQSYDKFSKELISLRRLEIFLCVDLATNTHNKEYLSDWQQKLNKNLLYSCSFRVYNLSNSDLAHITDLKLTNKITALSFGLDVLHNDLKNIYDLYTSNSLRFLDKDFVDDWKKMNINTLNQLSALEVNFSNSEKEIKETIAYLRAYYKQKNFTIYRLLSFFSLNIYPRINDLDISNEIAVIDKNLTMKAERIGSQDDAI